MRCQRAGNRPDSVLDPPERVEHLLSHRVIHSVRGETGIDNWRGLLLWRWLVDLDELGPADLIGLLLNALEHVWAGSQRVLQLLNHLASLLLNDPRIPGVRRWLLIFRALLVVHCRRVDI